MLCKVKIRVTAICNAGRHKAKTQYLNVNLDRFLILDIHYLPFVVKPKDGIYLLVFVICFEHLKFAIQILLKFAFMSYKVKRQYILMCICYM